jgi:cysteine synthase A
LINVITSTKNRIADNALDLIGNTPMVKLNHLHNEKNVKIFAKLEMFNPGSSVKDRIALSMVEDAERTGNLIPGKSTIIEPTSGNTGIGLALVAAIKGYPCIVILPDSMSVERRKVLDAFGAKVVLTPGEEGFKGAIEQAEKLLKTIPNSWSPMQINNMANPQVHYQQTGKEIWEDMSGDIDIFVCAVGTGGTLTGVAEFLKSQNPKVQIVAVEPFNSPLLSGGIPGKHKIQGLNAGFIAKTTNISIIDQVIKVKDEDAFETAIKLARMEGLFVGISSGAAAWGAVEVSKDPMNKGKKVVTLFPDTGERYLSTDLWRGSTNISENEKD